MGCGAQCEANCRLVLDKELPVFTEEIARETHGDTRAPVLRYLADPTSTYSSSSLPTKMGVSSDASVLSSSGVVALFAGLWLCS